MAIGERIRFFRKLYGLTMKYLGMSVGFPESNADVRIAQYENDSRAPKAELTAKLADVLGVAPEALKVPDIDSDVGIMHTLFALEDRYGFRIETSGDVYRLTVDPTKNQEAERIHRLMCQWRDAAAKLESGEISREEYDDWRYNFHGFE